MLAQCLIKPSLPVMVYVIVSLWLHTQILYSAFAIGANIAALASIQFILNLIEDLRQAGVISKMLFAP